MNCRFAHGNRKSPSTEKAFIRPVRRNHMSEVEEVEEFETGVREDDEEEPYLIVSYEEDPIENYDTRLLAVGLALSFLFGLLIGLLSFLGIVEV